MRICSQCGKTLEGSATRCPECGSTSVTWTADQPVVPQPETPPQAPETPKSGITIIFDKGEDTPVFSEPTPESDSALVVVEPTKKESVFSLMWQTWRNKPGFWVALVVLALLAGGGVFLMFKWNSIFPEPAVANQQGVDETLARQFSHMVDEMLPEKLEWGREIMKRRVPTRFPEELLMAVDKKNPEIRFLNPEQTSASYRFTMAYHFKDTNRKLYPWASVIFYFEMRNGKWVITGDRWVSEWEISFE